MGLFTKKEKYNTETGKFEPVEKEPLFKRRVESKELTHEEQFEERKQPWKTERGKRVAEGFKKAGKRVDTAVVRYNRTHNPMRNNFNPFGATFDRGMTPMKKPKSKSKKYIVRGGKAYPIAGTGKKKHRKRKQKSKSRDFGDPFDFKGFGGW